MDYSPLWPGQFEALRSRLANALEGLAITIEHVGSTAAPGLAAKPILDDLGVPGREAFRAPAGELHQHLYVCPDNREYQRHIVFRHCLRSHHEDANAYASLKRQPAIRFRDHREACNNAKSEFVERILRTLSNEKTLSKLAVSSAADDA